MKKIHAFLFFTLCILSTIPAKAQHSQGYCGTQGTDMKWLNHYVQHRNLYNPEWGTIMYLPLQVHLVADSMGKRRMSIPTILQTLHKVNQDMQQAEIRFYLYRDFDNIDNTTWFNHDYSGGAQMMRINNIRSAVNVYTVGSPAGNCGYYLPGQDAVALSNSCSGANSSTLTHELGHLLSLPHTFFGCEGVRYNPNEPLSVFKSKIRGTLEKVDGSNCSFAADRFCDTEPDYLSYRWTCNGDGRSSVLLKDENNQTFRANGTLFMSYANDACATRFSDEQIEAMRANISSRRGQLVAQSLPQGEITSNVTGLLLPEDNKVQTMRPAVAWEPVQNATRYYVKVSKRKSFGGAPIFKGIVKKNEIQLPDLKPGRTYYIKIYPYNFVSFGAGFSPTFSFQTESLASTGSPKSLAVKLSSNLIARGATLQLFFDNTTSKDISLYDLSGKRLFQTHVLGRRTISLPMTWPEGNYFLRIMYPGSGPIHTRRITVY